MAWPENGLSIQEDAEMEGMLSAPPQRTARRLPWVAAGFSVFGIVALGLSRTLAASQHESMLAQVSMIHNKLHTIMATAIEKGQGSEQVELLIDSYEAKSTPPDAMTIKAVTKTLEEGKWPKWVITVTGEEGKKGADLKKKASELFGDLLEQAPEKERDEIKEAFQFEESGDDLVITVTPPHDAVMTDEDVKLKKAFKERKPKISADLLFGRTFEDMAKFGADNIAAAPRGIEVKLSSVFATATFDLASKVPNAQLARIVTLLKLAKVRSELYYSSVEELSDIVPGPKFEHLKMQLCAMMPGPISGAINGLSKVATGVKSAVLEGLPYDQGVTIDFTNFNPFPLLSGCGSKS